MRVNPEGSKNAKVAIVGEAPGSQEDKTGKPFVGASGSLLFDVLGKYGILRRHCYITNVLKTRPPKNNFGVYYEDSKHTRAKTTLLEARDEVRRELREVNPNVTITLGSEALKAVTGKTKISDWRGSIIIVPEIGKVVPTYHPAAILRQWDNRGIFAFDLERAVTMAGSPSYTPPSPEVTICETLEDVRVWTDYLKRYPRLAFDIELYFTRISCISFCGEPGKAVVIPLLKGQSHYWNSIEREEVISKVGEVLTCDAEKIGQNATFDVTTIAALWGIDTRNFLWDTMIMHHLCYPFYPKSLNFLCSIFTNYGCYWDKVDYSKGGSQTLWHYNGMDSIVSFECLDPLVKELEEKGMLDYYRRYLQPLILPIAQMQNRGILVDKSKQGSINNELEKQLEEIRNEITAIVGREINPSSPKQVKELLYDEMKLPKRTKDGRVTTGVDAIYSLLTKFPDKKVLSLIADFRSTRTVMSNHVKMRTDKDGRARCSFNIAKAYTGRLASSRSIFGSGTNFQNFPREEKGGVRDMIIADPGFVLVEADLKQADARFVALASGCDALLNAFASGEDVHRRMASEMFGIPIDSITPHERFLGKKNIHASNYGMRSKQFALECAKGGHPISEIEAGKAQNAYLNRCWEIRVWQNRVWDQLCSTRTVATHWGRSVTFLGRLDKPFNQTHRNALALYPQGSVAELINLGFLRLQAIAKDYIYPLLQVHDSFIWECRESDLERVFEDVVTSWNIPIVVGGVKMVIPIDVKIGPSLGQLKEVDIKCEGVITG